MGADEMHGQANRIAQGSAVNRSFGSIVGQAHEVTMDSK
jgi:hypothetical protein